mmetsp:Transcript_32077/g.73544  ORF Transcript_32077/g.73544 Transcript_32077/m.73544 type:complete len:139 (+) Transcript_32077:3-419(+)
MKRSRGNEPAAPAKKERSEPGSNSYSAVVIGLTTFELAFKKPPKDAARKRPKALKHIITGENYEQLSSSVATYANIEAPPSLLPPKKYCDITGHEAKYCDPQTKLRYCSADLFQYIRGLSDHNVTEYLGVRNAAVVLK